MLKRIKTLEVGKSIEWHNSPLSSGMISDAIGGNFSVRWITTDWEASEGYHLITRWN